MRHLLATLVLCGGLALAQPSGTLRLYTSQPDEDAARTVAAFGAAYPEVEVELFRSGTEEVISRFLLEAESSEPQADVLLVADAPTFELLKDRQLLEPYCSPEAESIDAAFYDADCTYFGTKVLATVIAYNTALAEPITSWAELADVEPGQLIMPSPSYSGAAAYNLGVFTRTEGIGFGWFEQLEASGAVLTQGNGTVARNVASGEQAYGVVVDFLAIRAREDGSPVEVVYPDEGVPVITEPVGIVAGTPNLGAAQAFVDFLLSREGQEVAAGIGYQPLRDDVEAPAGFPPLSEIRVLTADPAELAETRDADKERFRTLFGE